ncbi:MAG: alanine racemase [Undibacterium sp.]|nr:alanine racemase [Opitutaceae bacterium]
MSTTIHELTTPAVLVDRDRMEQNIRAMQAHCDAHGVELRPHVKTHKMIEAARRQRAAGARGLVAAKLGEAEALLPAGPGEFFIAHALVDQEQGARVAALSERLGELRVAATSAEQAEALERVARRAGRRLGVMMAVDTGLGREGVRALVAAQALAAQIGRSAHLELKGFYSHEGQLYGVPRAEQEVRTREVLDKLCGVRDAIDVALPVWPGCSVNARIAVASGRVQAVRPGAYLFGDLYLSQVCGVMAFEDVAVSVWATVIDKPEAGLALIDAGSKVFSSDRTPEGVFGATAERDGLNVVRVNEEHGYVGGAGVDALRVGERLRFVPAHVCTVINLTDTVTVVEGERVVDTWTVDARGCVR